MKILITGGQGFLGRYIIKKLEHIHQLIITDQGELNVCDKEALIAAFTESRPEAVLHLAALCGANPSVQSPYTFFDVNLTGTLNTLEACRLTGVKRFIFMSSMTVFGKCGREPVTEDSPFAPRHPYASAKAGAEMVLKSYVDNYQMSAIILRPTLVVGEGCKEKHAIGDFLAMISSGQPVEIFGDGSHIRDFIHPEDVAEAVTLVADKLSKLEAGALESYNFSNGERYTILELVQLIAHQFPGKGRVKFTNPNTQTFSLFTSSAKAEKVLGWRSHIKIADILRRLQTD